MKRLFLVAGIAACMLTLSASATGRNLPDALQSFYKTFQSAQNVNYTEVSDMLRIGFIMDGRQQFAYYSDNDLVVLATEIKEEELPENLKAQLSQYKGFVVSQAYELTRNKIKEYCVVMKGTSKQITLKGKNKWRTYVNEKF